MHFWLLQRRIDAVSVINNSIDAVEYSKEGNLRGSKTLL